MHTHASRERLVRRPLHSQRCIAVDALPRVLHALNLPSTTTIAVQMLRPNHAALRRRCEAHISMCTAHYCKEVR